MLHASHTEPAVSETEWVGLIRSVASRDERALQSLYQRMHRIVFTLSVRITGNRETAEEVTLDVFHAVWQRAAHYDPAGGPVVGWIMNLTRSRAIDRVRFEQRQKRVGNGAPAPVPAVAKEPHEDLQLRDDGRILREALQRLSDAERQAIETAFFRQLTYAETAARLSQPLGTIKTRVRSGLKKLREAIGGGAGEP